MEITVLTHLQTNTTKISKPYKIFAISIKLVFSNLKYVLLGIFVAAIFWIIFSMLDQLLFFSPILAFYIPKDATLTFVLSSVTSVLIGMVTSMNVYAFGHSKVLLKNKNNKNGTASLISGSFLAIISSICASCTPSVTLFIAAIVGSSSDIILSSFLSTYQVPLRILSLLILVLGLYSISNKLSSYNKCNLVDKNKQ